MQGRGVADAGNASGGENRTWSGPYPVSDPESLRRIVALREAVWRDETELFDFAHLTADSLSDEHDDHGLHWVVKAQDRIVAAARVCIHENIAELPWHEGYRRLIAGVPGPIASLNRLVVQFSVRRQGISQALIAVRIEAARARGARTVILEAPPHRIAPMRALGFRELGYSADLPGYRVRFMLMAQDLPA